MFLQFCTFTCPLHERWGPNQVAVGNRGKRSPVTVFQAWRPSQCWSRTLLRYGKLNSSLHLHSCAEGAKSLLWNCFSPRLLPQIETGEKRRANWHSGYKLSHWTSVLPPNYFPEWRIFKNDQKTKAFLKKLYMLLSWVLEGKGRLCWMSVSLVDLQPLEKLWGTKGKKSHKYKWIPFTWVEKPQDMLHFFLALQVWWEITDPHRRVES